MTRRSRLLDCWNFDLSGWIHAERALQTDQLCAGHRWDCMNDSQLGDVGTQLCQHDTLTALVRSLCGESAPIYGGAGRLREDYSYKLDRRAALLPRGESIISEADHERLRYDTTARVGTGLMTTRAVRALWALDPSSALVVTPGSHKAEFQSPTLERAEELDATTRLSLQRGDLVLLAGTTQFGLLPRTPEESMPRVLELLLVDHDIVAPAQGYVQRPMPPWVEVLPPHQRAVVAPRLGGYARQPLVVSGETVAIANTQQTSTSPVQLAPADEELWQWDTQGYVIVRGVMDKEWLVAANEALGVYRNDQSIVSQLGDPDFIHEDDCVASLRPHNYGTSKQVPAEFMRGLEGLPPPFCDPFVRLSTGFNRLQSCKPVGHYSRDVTVCMYMYVAACVYRSE